MTWIVKSKTDFPYCCHADGTVWGPELSDAKRFSTQEEAAKTAALGTLACPTHPARVVRLHTRRERRRALSRIWRAAKSYLDNLDGDSPADRRRRRQLAEAVEAYVPTGSAE